ncbi:hypothetical protein PLESTB_000532900 [Pleodorina starrii]|uniref:U-box domain-containing protein n=1 Tax=Pleodorina starrii TaxID=330485 RepID=A0A9W6BGH3_9CHLO|nr:hypothetical protein PLESTM_000397100 [Pleodorina starrii]GLC51722.1 hypothetical protein PLESTB_000532900 [Pleodorina starrii]GLC72494.1 hypothetical protein PLESTF_001253600 [Pleodorina starrii]
MSQDAGNVPVSADQVRNAISGLVDREKNMLTNLDAVASSIMTAADYLAILKDSAQVGTYKELLLSLGKLSHEVRAHQGVLLNLGQTYQASLEDTDFQALLDRGLSDSLQRAPYRPEDDRRFKEFTEQVGGAGGSADQADGAGDDELGEDEDLREADTGHSLAKTKCPLSMKEVLDLERPVKDHLGYVYEHANIMEYLRGHPNGRKHPCAGVNGLLRASDLKPAEDVLRAKRRRRLAEAMGADANDGASEDSEEVIDV